MDPITHSHGDDFDDHDELEYQPHRVDDPDAWGLRDVARGRTTMFPVTVYRIAGDNASGVVGMLYPNGNFVVKRSTREGERFVCGTLHDVKPSPFEPTKELFTGWDGAVPEIPFLDEDGVERQGRSKGLLLGDYRVVGESAKDKRQHGRKRKSGKRDTIGGQFPHAVAA